MESNYQTHLRLTFNVTDKQDIKNTWAFAGSFNSKTRRKRRTMEEYKDCVITACSPKAKAMGIRAGMKYFEAKAIIPQLRILVVGDRHARTS